MNMDNRALVGKENIRKIVLELVADKKAQDNVCYAVTQPNLFGTYTLQDKYVPLGLRNAIEKIAYQDFNYPLDVINDIFLEIKKEARTNQKLKKVNDLVMDFGKRFGELKKTNSSELINLRKALYEKSKELKKIIDESKTLALTPNLLDLCKELATWFEGYYWHLCINIKRHETQEMIADPKQQALVDHLISERKQAKVTTGFNAALVSLSKSDLLAGLLYSRELLSLILYVLHVIRGKIPTDSQFNPTFKAIDYCIKVFQDDNCTRNKSFDEQEKVLVGTQDNILSDLKMLSAEIRNMQVIEDMVPVLKELGFLLDCYYYEAYKDIDNKVDIRNNKITKLTNGKLDRMKIALPYHEASLAIDEILLRPRFEMSKQSVVIINESPVGGLQDEVKKEENIQVISKPREVVPDLHQLIDSIKDEKRIQLAENLIMLLKELPAESELDVSRLTQVMQHALTAKDEIVFDVNQTEKNERPSSRQSLSQEDNKEKIEEAFWQILDQAANSDELIKIEALCNAFQKYGIPEGQKINFLYLNDEIPALFKEYKSNTYLWQKFVSFIPLVGSYLDPYLQRANIDVARKTINPEKSLDADDHLKNLFMARCDLAPRRSGDLLPKIDKLLIRIYTHLHNSVPASILSKREQQNKILIPPSYGTHPNILFQQSADLPQQPGAKVLEQQSSQNKIVSIQ